MESSRKMALRTRATAAAMLLGTVAFVSAAPAYAEGPVTATGKGTVGMALVGGAVTATTMGLIGVEKSWAYLVFPPAVAIGAGIGGYYMEPVAPTEVSVYMLGLGMALIIPTVIVSLNATAYKAPDDYQNDPSKKTPAQEPPQPRAFVPRSLVDMREGALAIGLPPVQVRAAFTTEEMAKYGVAQAREVHVPVFAASF